jgi:DNA helicase IV
MYTNHLNKIESILKKLLLFKILRILSYILYIIYIGKYLVPKCTRKVNYYQKEWKKIQKEITEFVYEVNNYCKNKSEYLSKFPTYLIYREKESTLKEIRDKNIYIRQIEQLKEKLPEEINSNLLVTKEQIRGLSSQVKRYNEEFVKYRKEKYHNLFVRNKIVLDDDQQTAIITDDTHNLVVAGAGSGKTEVLVTRIGYLATRKPDTIGPKNILALAFQTKAKEEIKERLKKRYNIDVDVKTFHGLGNKIQADAEKILGTKLPTLKFSNDEIAYKIYIKNVFNQISQDRKITNEIVDFMKFFGDEEVIKKEGDFKKKEEFYEYQKNLTYTTLDGRKVKSESEREIYNFFFMHKLNGEQIQIEYESPAEWMKYRDQNKEPPKPDFFFPEHKMYLEHWALGKDGKVPRWFGENATEKYKEGMEAKKTEFEGQEEFTLIESSHADCQNDNLIKEVKQRFLTALKKKFPKEKFVLKPKPYEELVEQVWEECKLFVDKITDNISTFITIAKTYSVQPEELDKRIKDQSWPLKQRTFAKIANRIYKFYQKDLRQNNEMDFCDMINLAVKLLKTNPNFYKDKFSHILVDEYQDISNQRYQLINELMKKNKDSKLFCVGDDWQSIMGFSGSNIKFFVEFEKYFSHHVRTDLTKNYRSVKEIVDTGAQIIKHNGEVQLKKETKAHRTDNGFLTVFSSMHTEGYKERYLPQVCSHAVNKIKELFDKGYKPKDIMCLSRITANPMFVNTLINMAKNSGIKIAKNTRSSNEIPLLSVHKSKGLESKIVFIFNVDQDTYGFPCELENPKVFEIATNGKNEVKEEEERRLFYVAVTRAKEEVIIYNRHEIQSKFVTEIRDYVKREQLRY